MDEIKLVNKFEVSRKTWLRGEGSTASRLLRPSDGKMCCIGSFALACGFSTDEISNAGTLTGMFYFSDMAGTDPVLYEKLQLLDSRLTARVYNVNDDEHITDEVREAKLTEALAKLFIAVEFVD